MIIEGELEERRSLTQGTATTRSGPVPYEACAESVILRDDDGRPACSVFAVTYTRTDVPRAGRPVVYAFDGGPGTATVTLHLALLGPRGVAADEAGPTVPVRIVDNPQTIIDVADLVVVDGVNTGFSRTAPEQDPRRFCGYTEEMRAIGAFIAGHAARTGRSASPVVVLGESYGGSRAAGLAFHLEDRHGIYPAGIVLVAPAMDAQSLLFHTGNDLPYVGYLPTFAAVAHHHGRGRTGMDVEELAEEVAEFATATYLPALYRGSRISDAERTAVADRLAGYLGLPVATVLNADLRLTDLRFYKELLRDRRRTTGRADPRVLGIDRDGLGETFEHDPSTAVIRRVFSPAINHYLREELGYRTALGYPTYNAAVLPWDFSDVAQNRYHHPVDTLRLAMSKHPTMPVLVQTGLYDGSVPWFAIESTLARAIQDPELHRNIELRRYRSGHILYLEPTRAAEVAADLDRFLRRLAA